MDKLKIIGHCISIGKIKVNRFIVLSLDITAINISKNILYFIHLHQSYIIIFLLYEIYNPL